MKSKCHGRPVNAQSHDHEGSVPERGSGDTWPQDHQQDHALCPPFSGAEEKAVNLLTGLTAPEKACEQNGHKMVTNEKPAVCDAGQVLDIIGRGERI